MDGMLSQDEINALLNDMSGASDTAPQEEAPEPTGTKWAHRQLHFIPLLTERLT